jgi:hypothetical protein
MKKSIPIGSRIMFPCTVRPGPFLTEKMVAITTGGLDWFGFVGDEALTNRGDAWFMLGTVIGTRSGDLLVRVPGHSPTGNVIRAPRSNVSMVGEAA